MCIGQWRRSWGGSSGHGRCTFSQQQNNNNRLTSAHVSIQLAEQLLLVNDMKVDATDASDLQIDRES